MKTETKNSDTVPAGTSAVKRVIVIGGGIGGLTTAIALQRRGIETRVYESAPDLVAVGAGIWMAPNALAIFDRLGFLDRIVAAGFSVRRFMVADIRGRVSQEYTPEEISKKYPILPIHRAALQAELVKQLQPGTLVTGKRCTNVHSHDNGATATFDDGTTASGDIIVGADGIRSAVRASIFGETAYRYSGQTCRRGIVHYRLPETGVAAEIWGIKAGARIGCSQVSPDSVYFYATECAPPGGKDAPGTVQRHFAELYADFPAYLQKMLASADEETIIRTDLWDFAPISLWHQGRVVLVGDAAHATTPNLGQGGCQAVEDGYTLARTIAESASIEEAFLRYEAIRMKKARFVVNTSYSVGQITNWGGAKARLRNAVAPLAPKSFSRRRLEYLFSPDV